ncbi:hypothetical protein [Mycolicibacterium pyrenivorans]|uniref:hypothetical protein n=1 Tax=Mycolicibacterium pyrenivorans TaxID=187102 RepID=UPI0021F3B4DC|nr:hypothetical protein [Mycolicibacterium pyrenivorans]MCV7154586.1 hypothetical protein [Mycolicibacterium pyrenivorans]
MSEAKRIKIIEEAPYRFRLEQEGAMRLPELSELFTELPVLSAGALAVADFEIRD